MKPLGSIQKAVIKRLKDHGSWFYGCGWVWDTPGNTEKVLKSLVKRGLVKTEAGWSGPDFGRGTTVYKLQESSDE
jgi:hypothetical protein